MSDDIKIAISPESWNRVVRERDEALSQIVQAECRAKRFCQERDEAIQERERWKMQAEQKWGMRRELEELLGVIETQYDEQFANGLAALRDLIKERDEARENLEEEKKFHHRTHRELVQTQCKVLDLTQAIIATLEENRHLADGDDCTLAKLKLVVPEWK